MSGPKRFLVVCGVAVAALLLVRSVWGQEFQEVKRPDGTTIKVPANIPPHVLERIRSGGGPGGPRPEPGKPDEKGDAKEQEGGEEDKDKDKKSEEGEQKKKDEGKKDEKESEEKPEPIKRESAPPKEADPKELEVRPDARGMVQFNFVGQKWLDVLEWLALISDMSLDWQELPGDYLNLTTQRAYSVRETRNLINQHLLARGFTLLSRGEILSVAKIDKLDPSMVPRVEPDELAERDSHEYVKVSFSLDWMLAEKAVKEFESMKSPNGKLTSLEATNRLEAMDAVTNLHDIYRVLKEEQSGTGQERLVREFLLEHTGAKEVLETLQELLGIQKKSSGSPKPMTPDQMRAQQEAMRQAAEQAKQGKGGPSPKDKPDVYLVANTRTNSILANAPPDIMAKIEQAIEALDVPSDRAHSLLRNMGRMQVYRLESVEPEPLIKTLEELGELDFDTRLEADRENNSIIAYASLADHLTIRALVEQLDGGGRRAEVLPLTALRAESVAKIVDFMMGGGREEEQDRSRSSRSFNPWDRYRSSSSRHGDDEHTDRFRVDADTKNNTLVLWCNEFELRKVEDLLERLRENQWEGPDPSTVKIYRLMTLDPQPFVTTLEEMETLGFQARLEVDEENNSIVAYASESDHAKIQELIEQLDGSGRQFHVVPLRRLEADDVAGTIAWMMAGKEDEQQSGHSRNYYYYDIYGSSGRDKDKKTDEFRVDADVEYNRLLLWANEIEMAEVQNLLVKLGEVPPEGGDSSTVRVLDVLPGPEKDKLLERIRRVWPSLAPNPLVTPEPEESEESEEKKVGEGEQSEGSKEKGTPAKSRPTTAASAATAPASPAVDGSHSSALRVAAADSDGPVFRFAQLEQKSAESAASQESAESAPPLPPKSAESQAPQEPGDAVSQKSTETKASDKPSEPLPEENATQKVGESSAEPVQQKATSAEASPEAEKQPAPPADSPAAPAEAPSESEQPPAAAPTDDARNRPPVSITEAPDGRLIITSEDTEALDQLEDLISRLAPPRRDYHVFELKFAEAYWVKWNLDDFFKEEDKESNSSSRYYDYYWGPQSSGSGETSRRLSKRRPLKFISDDDTNTILVQGATPDQLRIIEELIELYDQPPSTDSESARRTEVFQVRYSKADVVAEAVKEVYRDLLSDRDKALANRGQQQQQKTESRYSYTYVLGDEGDERKMPRWKGYLSVGIDTLSNTLIVSAPEFLFRDIERLITDLDEAAKPTDAVQVLQLGRGVSASVVQETLSKVLAEAAATKRSGGEAKRAGQGAPGPSGEHRGPAAN
ncbi:MAG TPA: secretin N-terminal domain-containing protein [Thermoguttaceae bacterium]|nr:secretin N-terminal domain-containing protein [Thermoguttaceae bacterium]